LTALSSLTGEFPNGPHAAVVSCAPTTLHIAAETTSAASDATLAAAVSEPRTLEHDYGAAEYD